MSKRQHRRTRFRDETFLVALGEHCKKLRDKTGYSIDRMAREGEQLSTSAIHRLESGQSPVSVLTLVRYAEGLSVHPSELFRFYESPAKENTLKIVDLDDRTAKAQAFKAYLPLYSLKAAAGYFGTQSSAEPEGWVQVDPELGPYAKTHFVARAVGRSMEPLIRDGDLVLFRADVSGTRQSKIVLAQCRGLSDPETGGSYTIKRYSSSKRMEADGSWRHREIILSPLNPDFEPIALESLSEKDFQIVAELVRNLSRASS